MVSAESIPVFTASIMLAYSFFRLILTLFKKGKQSICKYWSRFLFRLFFLAHVILYLLTTIPDLSDIIITGYISRASLPIALGFLVISIQDFVCYSNRDPTFIKRQWIWLVLPFITLMITCQVDLYQANNNLDYEIAKKSRIVYEVTLDVFITTLIIIPSIYFLFEIKRNDFSDSLRCKIYTAFCFFFVDIIFLYLCLFFEIRLILGDAVFKRRDFVLLMKSSRDPVMIMVCFTQDMVDWMLKWIYLDEDAILKQDYENISPTIGDTPLEIELVGADV